MKLEKTTYTPRELAKEMNIPHRIIFEAIKNDELRCLRFSSSTYRILPADVLEWINDVKNAYPDKP